MALRSFLIRFFLAIPFLAGSQFHAEAKPARAAVPANVEAQLQDALTGHLIGDGQVRNLRDGSVRKLHMDVRGTFDGQNLVLNEDMAFSDGERQHKVWTFRKTGPATWTGQRDDVVGTGTATLDGRSISLSYTARVKLPGGSVTSLKFNEHYDLGDPARIVNKTAISYLFFTVGDGEMTLRRVAGP